MSLLSETMRALREALALVDAGEPGAAQRLDRTLRHAVVLWIREGAGDREDVKDALADAHERAPASSEAPWRARWATLMDLLRDAARAPSLAEELRAVKLSEEGSVAWLILHQLRTGPARNTELAEALNKSLDHVSSETADLEAAGLVERIPGGSDRHMVLTPRGHDLLALLPPAPRPESAGHPNTAWGHTNWNAHALDEDVPSFQ